MKLDNAIVTAALAIGVYQMFESYKNREKLTRENLTYISLGALASTLWLVHQTMNGSNAAAAYTAVGLLFQLYLATYIVTNSHLAFRALNNKNPAMSIAHPYTATPIAAIVCEASASSPSFLHLRAISSATAEPMRPMTP